LQQYTCQTLFFMIFVYNFKLVLFIKQHAMYKKHFTKKSNQIKMAQNCKIEYNTINKSNYNMQTSTVLFTNMNECQLSRLAYKFVTAEQFEIYREFQCTYPSVLSPFRGGGIAYLSDPDSYAGWSFYTPVRATQSRQVEG